MDSMTDARIPVVEADVVSDRVAEAWLCGEGLRTGWGDRMVRCEGTYYRRSWHRYRGPRFVFDSKGSRPNLSKGAYTLIYEVGLKLSAAEAFDYLRADENRRCARTNAPEYWSDLSVKAGEMGMEYRGKWIPTYWIPNYGHGFTASVLKNVDPVQVAKERISHVDPRVSLDLKQRVAVLFEHGRLQAHHLGTQEVYWLEDGVLRREGSPIRASYDLVLDPSVRVTVAPCGWPSRDVIPTWRAL